jgi:hypothetical protein
MKKFLSLIFVLAMVFSVAACGEKTTTTKTQQTTTTTAPVKPTLPAVDAVTAPAEGKLRLGMGVVVNFSSTKATNGQIDATVVTTVINHEGKIVAATNEVVEVDFTFDATGKSTFDKTTSIQGKRELGDKYGMKAPYGSAREWYEHADAFVAACIGKKASEISSLAAADGKGNADLQAAGCTIVVDGFVKAATKIG